MFKILDKACTPRRGTKYSAYVDLFAREDTVIGAGETKVVPLGVKIDLDWNVISTVFNHYTEEIKRDYRDRFMRSHYLEVALRSSLAVKGLIIGNGIAVIDLDYDGEVGLIVHNPVKQQVLLKEGGDLYLAEQKSFKISKGDKVAQCTLKEHMGYLMGYESDVVRDGGYGSTGDR